MFTVRVHGHTGQAVLSAAEILAIAASFNGRQAQAWAGFGAERTEGEVVAYCRVDGEAVCTPEPNGHPDALIVRDQALLARPSVFSGVREDGFLLVDSGLNVQNLPLPVLLRPDRVITVPATPIARTVPGGPAPIAALIGGFAALTRVVSIDSVLTALRQWYPGPAGKANATAAVTAFGVVRTELRDLATAVR